MDRPFPMSTAYIEKLIEHQRIGASHSIEKTWEIRNELSDLVS